MINRVLTYSINFFKSLNDFFEWNCPSRYFVDVGLSIENYSILLFLSMYLHLYVVCTSLYKKVIHSIIKD